MIDELVKAANALQDADISAPDWHGKLKTLPKVTAKEPCLRVWLTDDGYIHGLEAISADLALGLRKFEPDLGKSLPGFNIQPLYRVVKPSEDLKKAKGDAAEKLKTEWTKEFLENPVDEREKDDFWKKTRARLQQSFGRVLVDLEQRCKDNLVEGETLQKFLEIIKKIDIQRFQKEYCSLLEREVLSGDLSALLMCYFVTADQKQKEDNDSKVAVPKYTLFLDVKDYRQYPVAHTKTIERLNSLLSSENPEQTTTPQTEETDAYGFDTSGLDKKFAEVVLPALGGVKLRSQVKAVPAQARYGLCEANTFQVGAESRKRTKRALEWLKDHDGRTYGIAGEKELLFAYPSVLPKKQVPLIKMLGAQQDNSYQDEDSFKRLAESVIQQLKGSEASIAKAELQIFSLRKMDTARTKVIYYRNITVASLELASMSWNEGCQNIPELSIRDWSKEKNEKTRKSFPVSVEGKTIFPMKLYRYLNAIWKQDGTRADTGRSKVRTFAPTDGLRLLLDKPNDELALYMLSRVMQNAQGFFVTLCGGVGKNEVTSFPGQDSEKEFYPGILGLLLFNLGLKKEEFMKESAFLLGRFLRAADEIHRLYCEIVRKKELPPQLCGSSLLVGMMESPTSTLNQLAMRSAPYVKWANAFHNKEKGGLVHYWMNHWSTIADQLHELEWPKRLTPEERAQVFLGFLATFPKSENTSKETNELEPELMTNQGEDK